MIQCDQWLPAVCQKYLCFSIRQIPVLLRFHICALWDQMLRIRCLKGPSAVTGSCAGVLVNSQHMCHTEIRIISFHSGRLAHTDKAASLVYPLCKCSNKLLILPGIPAAPGASGSTCIDYDIYVLQYTIFYILKGNKFHIHRKSGQSFVDVDQVMHISLMKVSGQGPGT